LEKRLSEVVRKINDGISPDPPSRHHLQRYLRSLLLAAYFSYTSVVAPRRLAFNTLLVVRPTLQKQLKMKLFKLDSGFWCDVKKQRFDVVDIPF
jgi:hypothetical protein